MSTSSEAEDFMPKLLDLFTKFSAIIPENGEDFKRFEKIKKEFQSIKDMHLFPRIKRLEHTLLNISALERPLRKIISGPERTGSPDVNISGPEGSPDVKISGPERTGSPDVNAIKHALDLMEQNVKQIKDAVVGVHRVPSPELPTQPNELPVVEKMSEEWTRVEDRIQESPAMASIRRSYEELESTELKMCCLSFSVFPENCVIKKRPLIYWWIGEGFVRSTQENSAEVVGEEIFAKLLTLGFTQTHFDADASKAVIKSCKMHPWIRRMLISLAQGACLFHFDSREPWMPQACRRACLKFGNTTLSQGMKEHDLWTVFNVNRQHLSLEREWISKLKKIRVLQLGRWQHLATYQIQVDNGEFLKGLVDHKHLKYLSLRGISRITRLPPAVFNLVSLEILDLRACHHLAVLPPDISSLRKLTHLDVSECYFLRSMPSGINKLTNLQVLKGFVIRDLNRTGCRIRDLSELKEVLRRLSIHIGNEAVVEKGELETLKDISSLRHLKISWGVASKDSKEKISQESTFLSFPPYLEKLDLQGIPLQHLPDLLNPSEVKNLKKLYIRGGELVSLNLNNGESHKWTVEILRLKYLSNLEIDLRKLEEDFPGLKYLEKFKCGKIDGEISEVCTSINATI